MQKRGTCGKMMESISCPPGKNVQKKYAKLIPRPKQSDSDFDMEGRKERRQRHMNGEMREISDLEDWMLCCPKVP